MTHLGSKIIDKKVLSEDSLTLTLVFDDGFHGSLSLKPLFSQSKPLTNEILKGQLFSKCFIESGALAWPNGLELCPDTLRQWIENSNKK